MMRCSLVKPSLTSGIRLSALDVEPRGVDVESIDLDVSPRGVDVESIDLDV
jgi:hypothetical protein